MLNDLGVDVYVPVDGHFVSQNHLHIAEIINDYDPTLSLAYIPPDKREPGDAPFAVVHRPLGGPEYVVFYADQCDERILERLWQNDATKHNVMSNMEAHNAAIKAMELKKEMEAREEKKDLVEHIIKGKNYYRHGGKTYS